MCMSVNESVCECVCVRAYLELHKAPHHLRIGQVKNDSYDKERKRKGVRERVCVRERERG